MMAATTYSTIQTFEVNNICKLLTQLILFSKQCIQFIKSDSKDIYNVTKCLYFK